jgi:hypothetical protein
MRFLRSKFGCIAVSLAAGFFMTGSAARADATLRYKFKDGEELRYEMEQKMGMEMNAAGQNIHIGVEQTIDMSWKIRSVEKDGKVKMTQKFDRVRFTMDGVPNAGKIQFDSKDAKDIEGPIGQLLTPILKALAGAEFDVTMDAQGKISDIKVPAKLTETFQNLPKGAGASDMFSEEGLKNMVSQGSLLFPAEAIVKGKNWEQTMEIKSPTTGKMKVVNDCTYAGPETVAGKKLEKITLKPKVTLEANDDAPIKIKLKDQDTKGEAYFDNEAGHMDHLSMTQNMNMELTANGMTFEQKIEQKITMKLLGKSK